MRTRKPHTLNEVRQIPDGTGLRIHVNATRMLTGSSHLHRTTTAHEDRKIPSYRTWGDFKPRWRGLDALIFVLDPHLGLEVKSQDLQNCFEPRTHVAWTCHLTQLRDVPYLSRFHNGWKLKDLRPLNPKRQCRRATSIESQRHSSKPQSKYPSRSQACDEV